MLRLSIRAFIALCAAIAVYVALLNWRGQRTKQELKLDEIKDITQSLSSYNKSTKVDLPPLGEVAENEILADTELFQRSLTYWIRENQEATLSWALSLESNEKKSLVFKRLLPTWMKEFPSQCSIWLIEHQTQSFVLKGLYPAIDARSLSSPYACVKLSLQLKDRQMRRQALISAFQAWVDKNPLQTVSYLDDIKSLPEYKEINLMVLSKWAQKDFEKAYPWILESKLENRDEFFRFVFLLNASSQPVKHLNWTFKNLDPAHRFDYVGEVIKNSYNNHKKSIDKYIKSQTSFRRDICYGWIAVYNADKGRKEYLSDLENIKSKKLKADFTAKCHLAFSGKYPGVLIKKANASDFKKMDTEVRNQVFRNFSKISHEYSLSWTRGKVVKELLKELIFESQDDSVSAITKNLQLASFFVDSFPLPINSEPKIDGLYAESYQAAAKTYQDFLSIIEEMLGIAISQQFKAAEYKVIDYRKSIADDNFRDLYTSLVLMHPDYKFTIHSLKYFKEIKNANIRNKVVNFMAWEMDGDNAKEFAEYAEVSGFLNYSLVSVILEKWASHDVTEAGKWLHKNQSNNWYIPACADFSRMLLQKSIPIFRDFINGIEEKKRNIFVNKLTIVLSESSPELLAILPGSINIKKYLQTSKKED